MLLGESDVVLFAPDAPPPDAFAPVAAHDKKWDKKGSVTWTDVQDVADHFIVDDVKYEKGKEFQLVARVGKRRAEIKIALGADPK